MFPFVSLLFVHWLKVKYIEIVLINKAMKKQTVLAKKSTFRENASLLSVTFN